MSKARGWMIGLALPAVAVGFAPAVARAEVPDTPAWSSNVGLVSGLGIAVLLPSEGGSAGGGLELSGRYGVPVGPTVMAPGARVGGYYLQERFIGMLLPTFRVTLPIGPLAPFVQGGVGAGGLSNPGEAGVAWLAGGGLMIHVGRVLAVGAEVNYEGITGTGFEVLSIGPTIVVGG